MQLYWSDLIGTGTFKDPFRPAVADLITAAGGKWAAVDLRDAANQTSATGRCLVGSTVVITPVLPARFLLDTATDLDILVPNTVINFINTQLTLSVPLQTFTWRQFFRRLMTSDGQGRWGVLAGELKLAFGPAGSFTL